MKKLFWLLHLMNCACYCQTTTSGNATYECVYSTLFNYSIDNGENFKKFESRLIISENRSLFFSTPLKETFTDSEGDERHVVIKKDTLFKVAKYKSVNQLLFNDDVFTRKGRIYRDTLFPMHWEFRGEKKRIDSMLCYKAIALFKGRNYIAWYCPALLIPDGPWKLGGLPGLIVEAYDENKQLQFYLKSFRSRSPYDHLQVEPPLPDFTKIGSYPDYIQSGNNFIARFKAQMNARVNSCLDCQSASKIEFHNLENVFR